MTLVKHKNGPSSYSYRVSWNSNKSWVTIGSCKKYTEDQAKEFERKIMGLVATCRNDLSYDD